MAATPNGTGPMNRDTTPDTSAPAYTMGYGPEFQKLLERRNAVDCAAHLLSHLKPGMRLLDLGCGPGTISVGLAEAVAPGARRLRRPRLGRGDRTQTLTGQAMSSSVTR